MCRKVVHLKKHCYGSKNSYLKDYSSYGSGSEDMMDSYLDGGCCIVRVNSSKENVGDNLKKKTLEIQ